MNGNKPPVMKITKVLLGLLIALFVIMVVLMAAHVVTREVFIVFLVLMGLDGIAFLVLRFGGFYGKAVEQQQLAETESQKEEAKRKGEIFCTKEQFEVIQKGYRYSALLETCPVCGGQVTNDDGYEMTKSVTVNEKVEGVFISRSYMGNQVEQAYQTVQKMGTFPATVGTCPHCGWKMHISKYTTYTNDEDPYSPMGDRDFKVRYFLPGKLYTKNMPTKMDENSGGCVFTKKAVPKSKQAKSDIQEAMDILDGIVKDLDDAIAKAEEGKGNE